MNDLIVEELFKLHDEAVEDNKKRKAEALAYGLKPNPENLELCEMYTHNLENNLIIKTVNRCISRALKVSKNRQSDN